MVDANNLDGFVLELGKGSEVSLAIALAIMMFSVALGLSLDSFRFLKEAPKPFFVGLLLQILALPLMTLLLCVLIAPSPSIALGMILVSCCPGGNVSNLLVLLARGNAALSVSLTASSSILAAFVTPIAIIFWSGLYPPTANLLTEINFNPWSFLIQTSLVLVLPLILGILANNYLPRVASTLKRPLIVLSTVILFAIIVLGAQKYWSTFLAIGVAAMGLVIVHNSCAFLLGNLSAKIFGLTKKDQRALTFEVGIQNSGLGIVILLTQLGGLGGAVVVTALWGVWHIIAGLTLVVTFVLSDRQIMQ